jgi:cytosine deaminase
MDQITDDESLLEVAIEQARIGRAEGGVPIGAALVADGRVIAAGHNRRVQMNSAIRHGETDALEAADDRPPAADADDDGCARPAPRTRTP